MVRILDIEDLFSNYNHIEALHGVSLKVDGREIVALIGSNGAGKTTLLNSISGHLSIRGSIKFLNNTILGKKPHEIARLGILHVPEGRHAFPGLTVEQNLAAGTIACSGMRLRCGNIRDDLEKVYGIFPRLMERRKQLAWSLSGGEQQMLVIGRALMGRPKLLMFDEPSMGLAPLIIEEVFEQIVQINKLGTPVLLVEQNASLALKVSNRAYIIERGNITFSGVSSEVAKDSRVREAYMGRKRSKA